MFQKKIIEKYLSKIDKVLLTEKYTQFISIFADKQKQENIRASKEEQYQEGFIRDLFCAVLGYTISPEPNYNIITELKNETKNKNNARKADGAIIIGGTTKAVIELKGTNTQDLDTVAKQAFDYKSHHENCNYVIVSNFERLRLYVETQSDFEEFNLFNLTKESFDLLYLLLQLENITNDIPLKLKHETLTEEKEITNNFYADYSTFKRALFEDLCENNLREDGHAELVSASYCKEIPNQVLNDGIKYDKLTLFKKTQKLLDRILFVLFCEDRNLLPANSTIGIINDYKKLKELGYYQPLYSVFKTFFDRIDKGFKHETDSTKNIFAYNGGLFKPDEILDSVKIGDDVLYIHSQRLANYDFQSQISVDILGRIFENSLTEIEEVQNEIENEKQGIKVENNNIGKRKKDGVFYTPEYITKYIVENTIGKLCDARKEELKINDDEFALESHAEISGRHAELDSASAKKIPKRVRDDKITELDKRLETYREYLLSLKILDPACGSGAFLNAALRYLRKEHTLIDYFWSKIHKGELNFTAIDNTILENNLYGVDINEDSIEITKLSLWLHTASKNRKLTTLNDKIKCGNSLIDDPNIAGEKAFDWQKEFPEVFEKGGFDVVIGNPPYVQLQSICEMSDIYAKCGYESYNKSADLYCLFYERGVQLLKDGGLLGFIASNKWLKANYGENLRNFFISKTNPLVLVDFPGVKIFPDATVDPQILILKKEPYQKKTFVCLYDSDSTDVSGFVERNKTETMLSSDAWTVTSNSLGMILGKMDSFTAIKDLSIEINYGIKTGYNDAFFIDGETKTTLIAEDPASAELIKPLFRGRDITAWTSQNQDLYLLNTHNGNKDENIPPVNIDDFPAIKKHLEQFIEKLAKRADKGDSPYNLRNCVYLDEFEKPKIVYPNMTKYLPFCYDESGAVCNDKAFIITGKSHAELDSASQIKEIPNQVRNDIGQGRNDGGDSCGNLLKYLLAIFNSKLAKIWILANCPELGEDRREIRKAYFENFPVPNISSEEQKPFIALADKMLSLNSDLQKKTSNFLKVAKESFNIEKPSAKLETFYDLTFEEFIKELKQKITPKIKLEWLELFEEQKSALQKLKEEIAATDRQINSLVYKLYGLTEEEIKTVEGQ